MIQKQQRSAAANHQQVLKPSILKIGEESTRGVIQHTDSGFFGHVFESSVATIAIKPVGQSRWLANIQVIEAVIVEVASRNTVVAVHVDAARAIQHRPPIVGPAEHLVFI